MPSMNRIGRRGIAALTLMAGLGGPLAAQPATPGNQPMSGVTVKVDPRTKALIVPLGGTVKWEPDLAGALPREVTVQNESMLLVRNDPTNPKAYVMTGTAPGLTKVTVLSSTNTRYVFDVVVEPDFEQLRNIIKRTLPTASVDIVPGVGTSVILTGFVNKPEDAALVERIAVAAVQSQQTGAPGQPPAAGAGSTQVINAIQIGGNQHVQIDLVVASVNRSEIRERAMDFSVAGTQASFSSIIGGLISQGGVSDSANLQVGIVPSNFFLALRALRTEGLAKFLAEPKLVTQSGRAASIHAGGQQAIISPQSGITGPGAELRDVGTSVDVLPIVMGNGKIYLEVFPRVDSVNAGRGIQTSSGFTPGFDSQTARSTVMLESGQTFAIGGLIETSTQATSSKVPLLGDIPFFGAAFSRIKHEERETELVILVTPRLVEPMDCNQVPRRVPGRETRSPDDYELFLETLLEAPRGQRKVWNGFKYNAAHNCDNAGYPCVGDVCVGPGGGKHHGRGANCTTGCATTGTLHSASSTPVALPPIGGTAMTPAELAPSVPVSAQPVIPPVVELPATGTVPQEIPIPRPAGTVK